MKTKVIVIENVDNKKEEGVVYFKDLLPGEFFLFNSGELCIRTDDENYIWLKRQHIHNGSLYMDYVVCRVESVNISFIK